MNLDELNKIAKQMVAPGKGLLAADESGGTIGKRFDAINTANTEENRRDYREFMFRTTDAMKTHISGVILYDETIRQKAKDGSTLVSIIEAAGAIPGIKVDAGTTALPAFPGELITQGLDGLRERFAEYHKLGARFSKWRAVIDIAPGIPSYGAINANAQAMARYAALAQEAGIVPIVEPEVLMDGDHTAERCEEVTTLVHTIFFEQLFHARVALEGIILKPNMIVSGKKCAKQAGVQEVAERTLKVLKRTTPSAVPGIAFLSGGQSDLDATAHLDAMNKMRGGGGTVPWPLTFSYGRALQAAPQKAWGGKPENVKAGMDAFAHRALMNYNAALGKWNKSEDKAAA
jgi:fructose-bisphosphate aldolase, class I